MEEDNIYEQKTGCEVVLRVMVGRIAACVEREHTKRVYVNERRHKVVGGGGETRDYLVVRVLDPGASCQHVLRIHAGEAASLVDAILKLDLAGGAE